MDEIDWEKKLEIATLKLEFRQLTGQEILEAQSNPDIENPDAPINFGTKEEKTKKILKDPKPEWAPPPVRDYPTTSQHYIICADPEKANESEPKAKELYGTPHKLGGFLVTDKLHTPEGWIKAPERGTHVDVLKKDYPLLHELLSAKMAAKGGMF